MAVVKWLEWVRRLNSIAQAGFTYNNNDFDENIGMSHCSLILIKAGVI